MPVLTWYWPLTFPLTAELRLGKKKAALGVSIALLIY